MPSRLTAAKTGPGGLQKIKRIEATGGVLKANTVTLLGGVVVTRAQDVIRGEKLLIRANNGSQVSLNWSRQIGTVPDYLPDRKCPFRQHETMRSIATLYRIMGFAIRSLDAPDIPRMWTKLSWCTIRSGSPPIFGESPLSIFVEALDFPCKAFSPEGRDR
jgi:hypothetical protein